jgi:hypothetical protein
MRQGKQLAMLKSTQERPGFDSRWLTKWRGLDFTIKPGQGFVTAIHPIDDMSDWT